MKLIWLFGIVCAAAAVCLGMLWDSAAESRPWDRAEVLRDGTVRLHYIGGECDQRRTVSVDETDTTVTLEIVTRSFATSCSDVGVPQVIDAELDSPVGERELVDGAE